MASKGLPAVLAVEIVGWPTTIAGGNHARAVLACDFFVTMNGDVPRALHLRGLGSGHSPDPALERDRPTDGGVDDQAVPYGGVGRSVASICRPRPRPHFLRGCRSDNRGDGANGPQDARAGAAGERVLRTRDRRDPP